MSGVSRLSRMVAALVGDGRLGDSLVSRICPTAVQVVGSDGAGLSLQTNGRQIGPVCSHGLGAEQGEDLQLTLGIGPCRDALTIGELVEASDLSSDDPWPGFTSELLAAGIRSVRSFPLQLGGARLGALTLYGRDARSLSEEEVADGYVLARLAAYVVVASQAHMSDHALMAELESGFERLAPVYQATGIVMAQLDVSAAEALVRLRARAFSESRTLIELSNDVVSGVVGFDRED